MLLRANKFRKDKESDCRRNELGSRIFVGKVFGDYAECLHFYPKFAYGRIIAGHSGRIRNRIHRNGCKQQRREDAYHGDERCLPAV